MSVLQLSDPVGSLYHDMVGETPIMRELFRQLEVIAPLDAPVLIEGEAGVGKALAARTLHRAGPRAPAPFLSVNAAEVSPALFEGEVFGLEDGAFAGALAGREGLVAQAETGTLLIEEVGSLSPASQAALRAFLDTRQVVPVGGSATHTANVRVICTLVIGRSAAGGPLVIGRSAARGPLVIGRSAAGGILVTGRAGGEPGRGPSTAALDPGLQAVFSAFTLRVPALAERPGDQPALARHFARRAMVRHAKHLAGISDAALALLAAYDWPGNVEELEEEMERAVILTAAGEQIGPEVLSPKLARE